MASTTRGTGRSGWPDQRRHDLEMLGVLVGLLVVMAALALLYPPGPSIL